MASETDKSNGARLVDLIIFVVLNFLIIGFSSYQTFLGYSKGVVDHWILAAAVAAISGMLFLAMNIGIRDLRLAGKPHFWPVVFYIIPLGFSFIGNFNAFYGTMMKDELYERELTSLRTHLDGTLSLAASGLDSLTDISSKKGPILGKLNSLESNYDGRIDKFGWGPNCTAEWYAVRTEMVLQFPHTSLIPDFTPAVPLNERMGKAKELVRHFLDQRRIEAESTVSLEREAIDNFRSSFLPTVDALLGSSDLPNAGPSMLRSVVQKNNEVVNMVISKGIPIGSRELADPDNTRVGSITHSLQSAFVVRDKLSVTIFCVFLSLVIDLAALVYILLFIPYAKNGKVGPRRSGVKQY